MANERKPKKILLVEDEAVMREIVGRKLLSAGFDVIESDNGLKALGVWQKEKPDLVLLDLILPDLDGLQMLGKIREDKDAQIANTPVIILSNLWSNEDILKAQNLRINGYLVKAYFTTEDILNKVNEVFASLEGKK